MGRHVDGKGYNSHARRRDIPLPTDAEGEMIDSNAYVLPIRKQKKRSRDDDVVVKQLSARKRKKLQKVIDKKEKKLRRNDILASLAKNAISEEHSQLMESSSRLGQGHKTLKQQLQEQLRRERCGLEATSGEEFKRHIVERVVKLCDDEEEEEEEEEEEWKEHGVVLGDDVTNRMYANTCDEKQQQQMKCSLMAEKQLRKKEEIEIQPQISTIAASSSDDDDDGDDERSGGDDYNDGKTTVADTETTDTTKETASPVPLSTPAFFVRVNRTAAISESRMMLPVVGEEYVIMEAIRAHPVIIVSGDTGSGKTTQIPQFLYEAGYGDASGPNPGMIAVTEPRRLAAISTSRRVAEELGFPGGGDGGRVVSYQVRYEGNATSDTRIKFVTDGVLLKEVESDFLLLKYSVVVVDEAHERGLNTDILIGLLSRIIRLRNDPRESYPPLRIVIMSATLRVGDFTNNTRLFESPPPVINVGGRQHPISVHFSRTTPIEEAELLEEAVKKVSKIHRRLPAGGILLFLPGVKEIQEVCKRLRKRFPGSEKLIEDGHGGASKNAVTERKRFDEIDYNVEVDGDLSNDDDGDDDDNGTRKDIADDAELTSPLHILPLYSLLSVEMQSLVFQPPPVGSRLCVVATNIAETSLTIPNIRYVVDSGKTKERNTDLRSGISYFETMWTSKAGATQRSGRSGRTGPGHAYRLYSSAVFNDKFEEFTDPEITRLPVDGVILSMKAMGIEHVINFPFPTPPSTTAVIAGIRLLSRLGALDYEKPNAITSLGRTMAKFPLAPSFSKMLVLAQQQECLPFTIAIVAALSVREIFEREPMPLRTNGEEKTDEVDDVDDPDTRARDLLRQAQRRSLRRFAGTTPDSDVLVALKAIGAFEYSGGSPAFCAENHLRIRAMLEVRKLRIQLTNIVKSIAPKRTQMLTVDPCMAPPSSSQSRLLQQIIVSGLGHHVARRVGPRRHASSRAPPPLYKGALLDDDLYLHPASVLAQHAPEWIVYSDVIVTSRAYMQGVTAISPKWLPTLMPTLCTFGKTLDEPAPFFDVDDDVIKVFVPVSFGKHMWVLDPIKRAMPVDADYYRLFARFILEGTILPATKAYAPHLVSRPIAIHSAWPGSGVYEKVAAIVQPLVDARVHNVAGLLETFNRDSSFLLEAYKLWVHSDRRADLVATWPPLNVAATLEQLGEKKKTSCNFNIVETSHTDAGFVSFSEDSGSDVDINAW